MAVHLLAFSGTVAASQTNSDLPGIFDGFAPKQNNHFIYPMNATVFLAYAGGSNLARARINSPSQRRVALPYIVPGSVAATPASLAPLSRWGINGPAIPVIDELGIDYTSDASGAATGTIGLWMHDGNLSYPSFPTTTVRGTASITGVSGAWTAGAITFDQTLPAGRYAVIGMDCIALNTIFARLIPVEGGPRPGCLARTALTITPWQDFRFGGLGKLMEFEQTAAPSLEIFCVGAPTTEEVYLDLVKIR